VVILGARLDFTPNDVGKRRARRKIYQEVFFTDADIAKRLEGFVSPIGLGFPKSAVKLETRAYSNVSVGDALRASISDPYLMEPVQINGEAFIAGSIDLYPIEVGYELANETVAVFPEGLGFIEQSAIESSFGIPHVSNWSPFQLFGLNHNARIRQYTSFYSRYWVDDSDFSEAEDNLFTPVALSILENRVSTSIPEDLDEFDRMIQAQWELGYRRGQEALRQLPNSKAHIRNMNAANSTRETRLEGKRERQRLMVLPPQTVRPSVNSD
jgi:hypothetical protein